ncbi:hypothetical protein RSOLAG22IIIB_10080 [Rhizoctonia solani]|uniref:Uncharacterized protein n=1 Tax=Rhizoctonia solani TaxID=456999 RepID=A0A0K6G0Q2_9AGAM|nr:hypothetical protein RSOLAG22IIIB_10080 [Rhizoctonia solani]
MASQIPAIVQTVFEGFPIKKESFRLDVEPLASSGKKDRVCVRALDGFIFLKDGQYVYPNYETSTPEWWKGVVAYGYVAALTGEHRFFVWAGEWDDDYEGKHHEVMEIRNILGMCKDKSIHWRDGQEQIVWIETAGGFSYALLEPAEEYDNGEWDTVIRSWSALPGGQSQDWAGFARAARDDDKPSWWRGNGAPAAWKHFTKPIRETELKKAAPKKAKEAAKEKGKVKSNPKPKPKQTPKPKSKVRAESEEAGASAPSTVSKRKLEESEHDASRLRKRKSGVSYVESVSEKSGDTDAEGEDDVPSVVEPGKEPAPPNNQRPSPSKAKKPKAISPKKTQKLGAGHGPSPSHSAESPKRPSDKGGQAGGNETEVPGSTQTTSGMAQLAIVEDSTNLPDTVGPHAEDTVAGGDNGGGKSHMSTLPSVPAPVGLAATPNSNDSPIPSASNIPIPKMRPDVPAPAPTDVAVDKPMRALSIPPAPAPEGSQLTVRRERGASVPANCLLSVIAPAEPHIVAPAPPTAPHPAPSSAAAPDSASASASAAAPAPAAAPAASEAQAPNSARNPPSAAPTSSADELPSAQGSVRPVHEAGQFALDNMTGKSTMRRR